MLEVRCLCLLSALVSSLNAQATTAIVGAKLIDGLGGTPIEDAVVIIENGRIRAAGPGDR